MEAAAKLEHALEAMAAARSESRVVDLARRAAREITGAFGVALVRRDGDFCRYIAEDCAVPLWAGRSFPIGDCISGWAMLNDAQAVIPNIYLDERIPHAAYRPTGIHSLVMSPAGRPKPFAALGAYWCNIREPTHAEITTLAQLAAAMGLALTNLPAAPLVE